MLKDLDRRQSYQLEPSLNRRLQEQLEADTRLLSSVRVMDYSLLLGVHQGSSSSSEGSSKGNAKGGVGQQQQQRQLKFAEQVNAAGVCWVCGQASQSCRCRQVGVCTPAGIWHYFC